MIQHNGENRVKMLLLGIVFTILGIVLVGLPGNMGITPSWEWETIVAMLPAMMGFILIILGMSLVWNYLRFKYPTIMK